MSLALPISHVDIFPPGVAMSGDFRAALVNHYRGVRSRVRTDPPRMLPAPVVEPEPEAETPAPTFDVTPYIEPEREPDAIEVAVTKRVGPTIPRIVRAVSKQTGVSVEDIISGSRRLRICRARQLVAYIAAKHTLRSTTEIGRLMVGFDHTTILNSRDKTERRLACGDEETTAALAGALAALRIEVRE